MPPKVTVDNEHHCSGCKKPLKSDSVQCNVCNLWFDMKCSGCDNDTAAFLKSSAGKKSSVHWHCESCESSTRALHSMISTINSKVTLVESNLEDLKDEFESMGGRVEKIHEGLGKVSNSLRVGLGDVSNSLRDDIKQAVEGLNEKIDSLADGYKSRDRQRPNSEDTPLNLDLQHNKTKNATDIVSQVASELREREKRALNVVFTGEVDKEKVKLFLQTVGTEEPSKVLEIKTLQKKTLYIVTMASEKDKWSLVSKARAISQSKDGLNNIFVNPDLTKTERDVQYQLRQEVRKRRGQGESVKISKGKVVVVQTE